MSPAVSPSDLRSLLTRVELVDVDGLQGYERPDDARVAEIALSLRRTGVLRDPIVIDRDRGLIIDGHHRREAFRWLRLPRIPAFTVDYLSAEVTVAGWWRRTDAAAATLLRTFATLAHDDGSGPWEVTASTGDGRRLAHRSFGSPRAAAEFQDRAVHLLRAAGSTVRLHPDAAASPPIAGVARSYFLLTSPTIDKPQVLDAARRQEPLPYQVNRHLIDRRPLGLNLGLDLFTDRSAFASALSAMETAHAVVGDEASINGRFYEERTVAFDPGEGP